jgi:O-antigen/teichoic acid export membrane protein
MIIRWFKKLWDSPTFTTWGNQAVQALRLLAITPLLLVSFNTTEVASWYLFGSLMFLGSILSQRVGLTFSRMIAFAMGGATDLSPIKERCQQKDEVAPNWELVERAYATTGSLNLVLTIFVSLLAIGMGWYGLGNLLANYADQKTIWLSFGIMVFSQSAVFFFQQYSMALRGMNYVALSNRWNVLFSIISVFAGVLTLKMGGGILELTFVMQLVVLLSIPRTWFLLRSVEEGRFKHFRAYSFDRQILAWGWEPAWKGFIIALANSGSTQLASILCARFLTVSEAAAVLLSIRLLESLKMISSSPLMSHLPLFARYLSEGRELLLQRLLSQKMFICQMLFSVGIVGMAFVGPPLLLQIGSDAVLLPPVMLLILGLLMLLQNFLRLSLVFSASGNHMVCVKRQMVIFVLSLVALYFLLPRIGIVGLLLGLFIPYLLILNVAPVRIAVDKINMSAVSFVFTANSTPVLLTVMALLSAFFFL